jgi:hypothetical protein
MASLTTPTLPHPIFVRVAAAAQQDLSTPEAEGQKILATISSLERLPEFGEINS